MSRPKPVLLLILDGWGHREDPADNAIAQAELPNWRRLLADCPHTLVHTSGLHVGLPDGQMGNSEVGHMNLGAGRIVYQDLTRVDAAIRDGSFFANEELLAACDVVSLHCPSLPETRHLINAGTLRLLKDGAVLVNTARGALIDHDALLAALQTGRISAGLDVYLETLEAGQAPLSAYRALENVVITPGIAGPAGTVTRRLGLYVAEEMFVVGTAAEVSAVNSVDDRPIPCPGPMTTAIASRVWAIGISPV